MTKHKLFARALALVLCLTLVCGLTGCVFSTPESVGRIGEVDIITLLTDGRLSDIAPTVLDMMHLEQPEEMTGHSLIKKYILCRY